MSSTFFINELTSLSSEAKRKIPELRNAADKSLQDLKSLPNTSEQQLAADLSRRPTFIEPFVLACNTRNPKFAASGIVCLQRLVISKGLPKSRLQDALVAFNACTDLSLDIQLKILQALPSLLQNYAADLQGDLLSSALQVCSSLQAVKASTVSGVANATLQQLVTTVFEKVGYEDRHAHEIATTAEVPGKDGPIHLRPAAFDAYRVFRDLALAAEDRKTKFVQFASFSVEAGLELIWSCIDTNAELFETHNELLAIIGSNVFPIIIRSLTEKLPYSITLRSIRVLNLIQERYLHKFPSDCEAALGLCAQNLEPDTALPWKRALIMELLRDFFTDSSNLIDAYSFCDGREGGKPIIQDIMSAFVRLSTEKPAAIGLGAQSSVPTGPSPKDSGSDPNNLDTTGGVAGVISSALGVTEVSIAGISTQWSLPKTPCMEQLDKNEPPAFPETYIYTLVLECLNGLSDSLARTVIPLTVPREKPRPKSSSAGSGSNGTTITQNDDSTRPRSGSSRAYAVPLNPLDAQGAPFAKQVKAASDFVDSCWPAVLATSSTFLNASLDDQYFRNLIKAYQRFAQVAGLLRLTTPRDALMTTLAKAAVPPHVVNVATSEPLKTPTTESPRVFSNSKSLLSMESLVSQASSLSMDKEKKFSVDMGKPMLTVRNLLCLRALLNLAIALGPTLDSALVVIIGTLRQADIVLSATSPQQLLRHGITTSQKATEHPSVVQAFSTEVAAVEAAASRLLESTADYPNDAFLNVLQIFCDQLQGRNDSLPATSPKPDASPSPSTPASKKRTFSGLPGLSAFVNVQARDYQFVIPKLGHLAELNVLRFVNEDPTLSGWTCLVDELSRIARSNDNPREARRMATNVLVKLSAETIASATRQDPEDRSRVQRRALSVLQSLVSEIYLTNLDLTSADLEVQNHVLDSLQEILERCGDSLVSGWQRIIAILSSAFEYRDTTSRQCDIEEISLDWNQVSHDFVSPQTGRIAFTTIQLICSDFLNILPSNVIAAFIELLYRFMRQYDDLNTALTTVSMAWNVSDMLFSSLSTDELSEFVDKVSDSDDLEQDILPLLQGSRPAQWVLLLLKLRDVAAQPLKEVRNAAFQTLCNVFKNHSEGLPPLAWDLLLRSTILYVSRMDFFLYRQDESSDTMEKMNRTEADIGMSKAIILGNADVLAQHLRSIEQIARLPSLWEVFLSMLERYLDIDNHVLSASVYTALTRVLAGIDPSSTVWKGPTYRTVHLWLKRVPNASTGDDPRQSNQDAFVAYAETGQEIYRLTRETMSMSQTRTMIDNLYYCIQESDGPLHGVDTANMSSLQSKTLDLLKSIRMDQPNIPSCLITVAAKFATLHHDSREESVSRSRPTFVAIASASVQWLQDLVSTHIKEHELLDSGALISAIQSLRRLVETKYNYGLEHKALPLWQRATSASLTLARPVLDQAESAQMDKETRHGLWSEYVRIASGIVGAQGLHLVENAEKIHQGQVFDIESFKGLREVLIPRLGSAELPESIRITYARSLFNASSVHPSEPGEIPAVSESPLKDLLKIRRGRWKHIAYSTREEMSYVCFKELISLASKGEASNKQQKLAQAVAPLLVLRLAIPLRAYIADQPLRGHRPQPLSQLEELLFCFGTIGDLKLEPDALAADPVASGESGEQTHMRFLYPLLVKAVGVAGDPFCGTDEVRVPLQAVLAATTPMP